MTTSLDPETLRLCSLLATLSFGLVFGALWAGRRSNMYLLHWSAGAILYGLVLMGFRSTGNSHAELTLLFALLGGTNVLLLTGARRFQGLPPFRAWMTLPVLADAAGHALPAILQSAGWLAETGHAIRIGESAGLALSSLITGIGIIATGSAERLRGRWIAGLALLGYVPGYLVTLASEFGAEPKSDLLLILPMVSDQLLLGVLNLGLLAMPAERARTRLRQAAFQDPLTGVANRAGLERSKATLAGCGALVAAVDIDWFKAINDRLGHDAGDEVLIEVADRLSAIAEAADGIVARTGGDEFVLILPPAAKTQASLLGDLERSLACGDGLDWSASFGVAAMLADEHGFAAPLKRADLNLYSAKAARARALAA